MPALVKLWIYFFANVKCLCTFYFWNNLGICTSELEFAHSIFWFVLLPIFSESTGPWLGTASQTDVAFCSMPVVGHHYQSGAGCTGTPFLECNVIHVQASLEQTRCLKNRPMYINSFCTGPAFPGAPDPTGHPVQDSSDQLDRSRLGGRSHPSGSGGRDGPEVAELPHPPGRLRAQRRGEGLRCSRRRYQSGRHPGANVTITCVPACFNNFLRFL
jgi:hypothetical protein